jgi:hypothetical protein
MDWEDRWDALLMWAMCLGVGAATGWILGRLV